MDSTILRGAGKDSLCRPTLRPAGRRPDSQPEHAPSQDAASWPLGKVALGVSRSRKEAVLGTSAQLGGKVGAADARP